jgi:hypothetical protein
VSQSGLVPPQPESVSVPARSSTQVTQSGDGLAPLHTPPAQLVDGPSTVAPQTPAVQVSVMHALPSLQFAAVRHCTHTGAAPEVSQNCRLAPQPVSRPEAESSTQATQIGAPPVAVPQNGVPPPQPASVVLPVWLLMHVMQEGFEDAPSQTPEPVVGQVRPAVSELAPQTPALQVSVVHWLPSLQSRLVKHCWQVGPPVALGLQKGALAPQPRSVPEPATLSRQGTHTGAAPLVSQSGLEAVQPESVDVPERSLTQVTQSGAGLAPLQTPPVQLVVGPRMVVWQEPETHASLVHWLASLQSEAPSH